MITLYMFFLIGGMLAGSFAVFFSYIINEQNRVARFHQRPVKRRQHQRSLADYRRRYLADQRRRFLADQRRRFVPYSSQTENA
jgi:hypothetical protein